jgi:DNA-binding response OmpR family regulator
MAENLVGKRILLVEDDTLIAMAVEDLLLFAQVDTVEIVGTVERALAALALDPYDVVILDISLRGEASWPVAVELKRRSIPYLTVTGYGDMLDHELVGKLLPKPYSMQSLLTTLSELLANDATSSAHTSNPGGLHL